MTPFSLLACEPHLEAGSKIYVEAAEGFDDDVSAAIESRRFPSRL
jgi:hypothetical protein